MRYSKIKLMVFISAMAAFAAAPKGTSVGATEEEMALLKPLAGRIKGKIAWSTSRNGNHDIWIMNADGTNKVRLTKSAKVDWFSRFSPDGKKIIFCRSKMGWTNENNAKNPKLWNTWVINTDGTGEKKIIPNSTWATWRPDGESIVFARGGKIGTFNLSTQKETIIVDAQTEDNPFHPKAILQNPHLSPNGKYLGITLRGSMREVGIYHLASKEWVRRARGGGCQINWFANGKKMVYVNPTGNGGSEIFAFDVSEGKPAKTKLKKKDLAFMDLPGRRSHEYFPQVSKDGKWMTWCATQRGHDHDLADYEVYIWEIGTSQDQAIRLTFHSGNDRWPDIYLD